MGQIDRGTYVRDDAKGGLKGGCVSKLLKVFAAVVVLLLVAMVSSTVVYTCYQYLERRKTQKET